MTLVTKTNKGWTPSFLDDFLSSHPCNDWCSTDGYNTTLPAVNIKDNHTDFTLELAIPGKTKESFNISVNEKKLIISTEEKSDVKEKDENKAYAYREFKYTSFSRSFLVPENVDKDSIKALYKDGILSITLPKKEEEKKAIQTISID